MEGLGIFLKRGNIFWMRFDNKNIIYDLKNNHYLYSTKISLKKNFYNLNNLRKYYEIDKNLITKTNYNLNSLLKSSIIKRNKLKLNDENKNNNELIKNTKILDKNNNSLRHFTLLKLKELNIQIDILEDIYNKKELLLVKLRKENNNKEFISKEILINWFLDLNKLLDYETVKKIINIYDNNNGIKIEHINNLFKDIHKIINKDEKNISLDSIYKNSIFNIDKEKKINEYENKNLPNIKIINTDHINENNNTYLN